MSKAEEAALKAYPVQIIEHNKVNGGILKIDVNTNPRYFYKQGYEQAEKDLGWHSVEESLPKVGEEVIVLTDVLIKAFNFHLFYRLAFGHIVNEGETVDIDGKPYKPESHNGWNIPGVKFWMPMPKIPNEE